MNAAYPLLPVTVLTILAYLTTWLFSRWGIFPLQSHRKGWNYLLLVTFLATGLLGLFSVIKINFNLEVKNYEQFLRCHVSFGIAMVVIALFHLFRHLTYYFPKSPKKTGSSWNEFQVPFKIPDRKTGYLLFLLGTITIINQLVFLREFMAVLSGNELIIGVVISFWLLLTGWGAFTARHQSVNLSDSNKERAMLSVTTFLPVLLITLLYWLKSQLFPPGVSAGLLISAFAILILLFPVCFLSGYLFVTLTSRTTSAGNKQQLCKSYTLESLGSLAGGILFSIILGRFFNTFEIVGLTTATIIIIPAFLMNKERTGWLWSLVALLIPLTIFVLNPDKQIKRLLFPNQSIILNQSTHYGNLLVTEQSGQFNFYENNELLFYTGNLIECEEAVHFSMLQRENPKRILLLSGGMTGMISEIEKYPVEKITCLEINPELFGRLKKYVQFNDKDTKVELVKEDIRSFLKKDNSLFDIILINLPPPSTLSYNRFYTEGFFRSIKNHCTSQTVICTSLPSTINYAGKDALKVNASLWSTIGLCFTNRQLLQGEKNYFLASASPIDPMIAALTEKRGIENSYVNHYYIDDSLMLQRSQTLIAQFDKEIDVNRDFQPFMFFNQINHWLSLWKINYWLMIMIAMLFFIALFLWLNPVTIGLYIGGFTSASLEMVLLFAFQLFFGTIYLSTSLFFAVFMGGLAVGSYLKIQKKELFSRKKFGFLQFMLAIFALMIPLLIKLFDNISSFRLLVQLLFFLLTFILAFGVGREYRMASYLQPFNAIKTSGINYSSDLIGSAFGSLLTTLLLLPVFGLTMTCITVSLLNLLSGNIAYFNQRS